MLLDDRDRNLLDGWQREFPLVPRPFAAIGAAVDLSEAETLSRLRSLLAANALSRIGAVVRPNTIGASTLAALAVPPTELEAAARAVVMEDGVNHAYQREHAYNLWFVVTASDRAGVDAAIARIEAQAQRQALVLPMLRDFHIDLGFPLFERGVRRERTPAPETTDALVEPDDRLILSSIERGLPLTSTPFSDVADQIGWSEDDVLARLKRLIHARIISRFGLVVRHRAFGYTNNAMVVWDLPDDDLVRLAHCFVEQESVTLCYERPRRDGWPYNLFTMIHARDRSHALQTVAALERLAPNCVGHDILFSTRCFRQRGARLSAA